MVIFNYLSGKLCVSVSLGFVSGDLSSFLCLEHTCLFFIFINSVLVTAYLTEQPPLPVFTNWSHMLEASQSVGKRFLIASQTSCQFNALPLFFAVIHYLEYAGFPKCTSTSELKIVHPEKLDSTLSLPKG